MYQPSLLFTAGCQFHILSLGTGVEVQLDSGSAGIEGVSGPHSHSGENLKLGDQSHMLAGLALFRWLDLVHVSSRGCLMGTTGARQ